MTANLEQRLAGLLRASPTLKIATAGGPVSPWLAAAFFAEDGLYELRLMIEGSGATLANLLVNPRVAVMVENGDPLALFGQADGTAALVAKTPGSGPLVSLPHLLPVCVRIERWRLTDVKAGWLPARELRPDRPAGAVGPRPAPPPRAPIPPLESQRRAPG